MFLLTSTRKTFLSSSSELLLHGFFLVLSTSTCISIPLSYFRQIFPNASVVLLTPPPVDHLQWAPGGRHNDLITPYADSIRALGEEKEAPVVDLWAGDIQIVPGDV